MLFVCGSCCCCGLELWSHGSRGFQSTRYNSNQANNESSPLHSLAIQTLLSFFLSFHNTTLFPRIESVITQPPVVVVVVLELAS